MLKNVSTIIAFTCSLSAIPASSGCSTHSGNSAIPRPVATPTPTSMAQLSLPLEAYLPSASDTAQTAALRSVIMKECMRRYGFQMTSSLGLSQVIETSTRIEKFSTSRRYGISDRAAASRYGYGMPDWTIGSARPKSLDEFSASQQTVLKGSSSNGGKVQYQGKQVPQGGCMGEAARATGVAGEGPTLAKSLQRKSFAQLAREARAQVVTAKWVLCMQAKGYHYRDSLHAGAEFAGQDGDGPVQVSQAEIKSAVATVDCIYQTNLIGVMFAVESDLQNIEIEKNAEALNKEKKQIEAQEKRLQTLTKQYGG
ncbi:hypothetical protein [Actinomadura macrotermitis]|uniref:Uncharacterized protein n=1 Tax=Actinomadura macrotermitis TaxID=2585200 RepID=A0A7K0BVX9_9ACTN|nr:hypothetical protein [Actinomadura macrotermitis]MQY05317.1 hypothetical protein [Actinomadura macrotermitis]